MVAGAGDAAAAPGEAPADSSGPPSVSTPADSAAARAVTPPVTPFGAVHADTTVPVRASTDSTRHRASPFKVMLRSAVLPGWGQVYNGKLAKAALVVGGEGLLLYKAVGEWQKQNDAAEAGDAVGADRHMNLKVNYLWWAAVVHLLQMADAYVDAQLSHFEADFEPDKAALPGEPSDTQVRLAFRTAF
jgi:hypothetical protein